MAKRNPENAWLPTGYYISKNRIVKQEYANGKFVREIKICSADKPRWYILKLIDEMDKELLPTLNWLIHHYLKSPQFNEKKIATQKKYYEYAKALQTLKLSNHKTFGETLLQSIKPRHIRRYLDNHHAKILANRQIMFLKLVFNWGRERYDVVSHNPCIGVKLHSQTPRTRYIEDWEYDLVKNLAVNPYIPVFMELAYLCRARFNEVASFTRDCISEKGLLLKRSKGSKPEITLWSPRLESVIKSCKQINATRISPFLIHDKDGLPIQYSNFRSAWARNMKKALKQGLQESFTFHDIKAKGISDHKDKASGHRSFRMIDIYDRSIDEIDSTR